MAVTYQDIPENLRRAACEAVKLRRAGKPVPDDIQEMSSRYKRWIYHGGQDPGEGDGRVPVHDYIPAELREAHAAVCRKRYNGQAPTKEETAMSNEYYRWLRHGGPPPDKEERPDPDKTEWPLSAYLMWNQLIKDGTAPGDIPADIADGRAMHLGTTPKRYTACSPSDRIGGRGCRGRHGKGPKRRRYGPGVAMCSNCDTSYTDVPDDVNWCGCCGTILRKSARFKS